MEKLGGKDRKYRHGPSLGGSSGSGCCPGHSGHEQEFKPALGCHSTAPEEALPQKMEKLGVSGKKTPQVQREKNLFILSLNI